MRQEGHLQNPQGQLAWFDWGWGGVTEEKSGRSKERWERNLEAQPEGLHGQ